MPLLIYWGLIEEGTNRVGGATPMENWGQILVSNRGV